MYTYIHTEMNLNHRTRACVAGRTAYYHSNIFNFLCTILVHIQFYVISELLGTSMCDWMTRVRKLMESERTLVDVFSPNRNYLIPSLKCCPSIMKYCLNAVG